ncbi:MAG: zf-TFIIB domain-containing protein [Candidatus Omnitrophica bacterium]|nr:zf-TFIIB domain-containing protein [Candidatus Omnitrophota bacterium]
MNCPVCNAEMVEDDFGGLSVDVCKNGCKGIWFDWFELTKLDEKNEGLGNALQEALGYERSNDQHRGPIKCPKCKLPMHEHVYSSAKEINVDECYQCGGFFLDSGELKSIRESSMTDAEREAYAAKLLENIPELAQARDNLEKEKARTQAIRNLTKFFRVSYYTTGK